MEKFIWNALGVLLFLANILTVLICLATNENTWCLVFFVVIALDWLYKEKRPEWIEV